MVALSEAGGWLAAVALAVPFSLGSALGDDPDRGEAVFAYTDPEVVESSGLATLAGGRVATVNDSGDTGRVFTVDVATGDTVGVTTWSGDPTDVEAVAPAGPDQVWVGDIGDNRGRRSSVEVLRVPVGEGERAVTPARFELTYPDGPRDAEALLAHPVTGRLLVVSKVVFGGQVHAAPRELDPAAPNELTALGQVAGMVTDGAFFPDGEHLILRNYTSAFVYTFPDLELVGEIPLPRQQQGEAVTVTADGEVLVGTEGQFTDVLRVPLPDSVTAAMTRAAPSAAPSAPVSPGPEDGTPEQAPEPGWAWLLNAGIAVLIAGLLVRAVRPR
ncbi:hypothetical protein [Nocardioides sp. 616]|uniref:hypothetical protein n=1 Tax=Nocardioides sp. 616 TaxID=2268090 RepID=UPI000CE41F45|nr:hypothetical protein [Nocardioides sp. 616]